MSEVIKEILTVKFLFISVVAGIILSITANIATDKIRNIPNLPENRLALLSMSPFVLFVLLIITESMLVTFFGSHVPFGVIQPMLGIYFLFGSYVSWVLLKKHPATRLVIVDPPPLVIFIQAIFGIGFLITSV